MGRMNVFEKSGLTSLINKEESVFKTVIPFINEAIGTNWSVEFREFMNAFGLNIFDVYIEAGVVTEYLAIQTILSDRLSKEFFLIGRESEYSEVENTFIFHWGTIHFQY